MLKKHKRVLWLLNHRTLMPFEVPLLIKLGYEVFVPKVIPSTGFRSGSVDHSYDASLSIPKDVLAKLNKFDFYNTPWSKEITTITNRYFEVVFTIPHSLQLAEVVDHFEGQIVLRAFGLDATQTYEWVLESLYSPLLMRKLETIRNRFWFGQGYENLVDCENKLFRDRALFLPIGVPGHLFDHADEWRCKENRILFVCPNAVTNAYYAGLYQAFKRDFGDLPHWIVGAQDVPVDDPNVLGFISDERLIELYLSCSALYYPSKEPRHVHYSPIEAAIYGMPVVFHEGSLLDRVGQNTTHGRVSTTAKARELLTRLLAKDQPLIADIKRDQHKLATQFSEVYCTQVWKEEMRSRGFEAALSKQGIRNVLLTEMRRIFLKPWAKGRTRIDPFARTERLPVAETQTMVEAKQRGLTTLEDGIDFSKASYPSSIHLIDGLSGAEPWGRWSIGNRILIVLAHRLEGKTQLHLRLYAYGPNCGKKCAVKLGKEVRNIVLPAESEGPKTYVLDFNVVKPANELDIEVPMPTIPPNDGRLIGVGIVEMFAVGSVQMSTKEAR